MRILYLHQYFKTPDEAGGTRSYEMGRRLAEAGHEVHMISSATRVRRLWPRWQVSTLAGMTVHRIEVPYSNRMGYVRRVWAFAAFAVWSTLRAISVKADIVLASSTPLTIAMPARIAAWWQRIPYVFEVRDLWPKVPVALGAIRNPVLIGVAEAMERWAYRGAARVVTLAPGMAEHVCTRGVTPERVVVIPNGCDCDLFGDDEGAQRVRREHDWLGNRKLVLYAGTIGLVNGVRWLVEVARVVRDIDATVRFAIVGDGREADAVRARAKELDVLGRNLFMLGELPKKQVGLWVRACDVAVSLIVDREYLYENALTNKFFDALAAGRPVVSNHPGYESVIAAESGAGTSVDATDYRAAARRLVQLLGNDGWLQSASAASAALGESVFSRDRLGAQLVSVLEDAVIGTRFVRGSRG